MNSTIPNQIKFPASTTHLWAVCGAPFSPTSVGGLEVCLGRARGRLGTTPQHSHCGELKRKKRASEPARNGKKRREIK